MVAPLSGGLSALGLGMSHSADLAVDQANQKCTVPGYALAFQPEDDQATPQVAGQAATKLASDPNVVGVVGTLNSSTSQTVQPILADRSIVQVSPANTNPTLTLGEQATTAPKRPFASYFRVATTDLIQGPFGAQYLVQKAGKKSIAVIDDGKTYGAGLADQFAKEAEKLGATIVAREKVGEKDTDFSGVIAKVRPSNPDAVYYGGEYPAAGPLSAQLAGAGLNVPLMGGDGIVDPQFVALGGRAGDLATNVGAPAGVAAERQAVHRRLPGRELRRAVRRVRRVHLRRDERRHRRAGQGRAGRHVERGHPQDRGVATCRRRTCRARAARSRSTSSATPRTRCSPSTRSRATTSHRSRARRAASRADARGSREPPQALRRGRASPAPARSVTDPMPAPHRIEEGTHLLATFLSQVVNGLILGSLIGLIALGYTMVYGIIQLINFAHGEVFMVGAYGGLFMFTYLLPTFIQQQWYLALPLLLVGGAAVSTAVAVLMERFAYRPLRGAPRLAPLITALGVSVALQELVRNFYPGATAALPFPRVFVQGTWEIPVPGGTVPLRWTGLLIIVLSLVLAAVLTAFVNGTRMGRAMRAVSQDSDTARLMGVDTDRVIVLTFALGAALAGVGGIMYGTDLGFINIDMGFQNGIFAFTAAVLGGIGNLKGAVVGGIVIGLVKALGGQYLPGGTAYDYVWIFVVLIAVLVFRPQGFFGESERVRA